MDPVIVVGAGPVGLSLSLALARLGVPCVVLDETTGEEDTRPARTAVLRQDTAAFVGRLGCADTLESAGTRWTAWRTMRRRRLLERVAFAPRAPDGAAAPAAVSPVHLPQHALTRALRAALADEKLAEIVTGSRLADLEQDEHGVSAQTRGPNGTWWRGSYLIGCDGPRSTVRKLLDIRFPGRTAVERHAVAALRCELPWPGEALLHRSPPRHGGQPGNEVSARPLADGLWRLDWLLPPGRELVTPDALVARIRDSLAGWTTEPPADAAGESGPDGGAVPARGRGHGRLVPPYELLDTGVHTVHHRLARCWRQGRAFLAGDAAHLLGALGTQGLDEGLRDAENLAWKLGLAWHHGASEVLLDSYQAERRGAVAARLRAADQALPLLRDGRSARWRTVLPGAVRGRSTLLTDGHLGRGPLGSPPVYARTPLAPPADRGAPRRDAPRRGRHRCAGDRVRRLGGPAARPARKGPPGGAGGARHGGLGPAALAVGGSDAPVGRRGRRAADGRRDPRHRGLSGCGRPHRAARAAGRPSGHRTVRCPPGRDGRLRGRGTGRGARAGGRGGPGPAVRGQRGSRGQLGDREQRGDRGFLGVPGQRNRGRGAVRC